MANEELRKQINTLFKSTYREARNNELRYGMFELDKNIPKEVKDFCNGKSELKGDSYGKN